MTDGAHHGGVVQAGAKGRLQSMHFVKELMQPFADGRGRPGAAGREDHQPLGLRIQGLPNGHCRRRCRPARKPAIQDRGRPIAGEGLDMRTQRPGCRRQVVTRPPNAFAGMPGSQQGRRSTQAVFEIERDIVAGLGAKGRIPGGRLIRPCRPSTAAPARQPTGRAARAALIGPARPRLSSRHIRSGAAARHQRRTHHSVAISSAIKT